MISPIVPGALPPHTAYIAPSPIGALKHPAPLMRTVTTLFGKRSVVIVPPPMHVGHIFASPAASPWDFSPHI